MPQPRGLAFLFGENTLGSRFVWFGSWPLFSHSSSKQCSAKSYLS